MMLELNQEPNPIYPQWFDDAKCDLIETGHVID
jgi:hypothetical protein